jgi:hypothetical protein
LTVQIQKLEIDIDTSLSYTKNIQSSKDDTMDFFTLERADDIFNSAEISNLDSQVKNLNDTLEKYKVQLTNENKRLADIKALINEYSSVDSTSEVELSSGSNVDELIKSADEMYTYVCNCVYKEVSPQIGMAINTNVLIKSLINSDPTRAALELDKNSNVLEQVSVSLNKFSNQFYIYNSELDFESNFKILCESLGSDKNLFSYQYTDDSELSSKINATKCNSYFKLLSCMIRFLNEIFRNSVSRETYMVEHINFKTKSKVIFTLPVEYEFIRDAFLTDKGLKSEAELNPMQKTVAELHKGESIPAGEGLRKGENIPANMHVAKVSSNDGNGYEGSKESYDENDDEKKSDLIKPIKFYMDMCHADLKFKKNSKAFTIEINVNLY